MFKYIKEQIKTVMEKDPSISKPFEVLVLDVFELVLVLVVFMFTAAKV